MQQWRHENSLTLEAAGQRIGVDLQQWHRWERAYTEGSNPTLKSLMRIADAMETELPTLLADLYWPSVD